ncbi:MAG: c-type cytochrome biogenesis protein CcsB [Armatimonadetes bacterium]|nr:c-type cytochrome biogenesis protein CcsB [Armatimonadota bacterium]
MHSPTLYAASLFVFGATAVLHLWSLALRPGRIGRAAAWSGIGGLILLALAMAVRGVEHQRLPFATMLESLAFVAWALTAIYLATRRGPEVNALGAFASLAAFVALGVYVFLMPQAEGNAHLREALGNRWSAVHIVSSLAAYASFVLAFGAALGYMLQERLLKAKRITGLQRHLPSLDSLDVLAYRMVALGFPLLTLGIITGAIWAQTAQGAYWSWDPKETWSLVTWLVYAAYLHVRIVQGWRGKWSNRLLVIGFAAVLITYFGVTYFMTGYHSHGV